MNGHVTDDEIERAVLNRLDSAAVQPFVDHVVGCMDCLRRLTAEEEFRQLARVAIERMRDRGEL